MGNTYEENLKNEWEKYRREENDRIFPTVLIAGASGVGKSSLINKIFGGNYATVSDVKPETQGFHIYYGKQYNRKVNLIDSAGYETNQADTYYSALSRIICDGLDNQPVHVVWYCISIANKRVEDFDIQVLSNVLKETNIRQRLCVVFTKCDHDTDDSSVANDFRSIIKEEMSRRNAPIRNLHFFETCDATDIELEIGDLIGWSANAIDDVDLKRCFISAQKTNLELKKKEASDIIDLATVAAAGIGAIPIPFSDAPLLTAAQVKMVSNILDVYELSNYASIPQALIGDIVISQIGKSIAGSIIKMIPGAGSLLGALINGTVASALTFSLGSAVSELCYYFNKSALEGKMLDINRLFDSESILQIMEKYKD